MKIVKPLKSNRSTLLPLFILIVSGNCQRLHDNCGIELPSDMKQLLEDITPNFEENLQRGFRNAMLRLHRRPNTNARFTHKIDNVLVAIDSTKIELRGLKFPWVPDFRINSMSVNLAMGHIDLDLNLGTLKVDGEYEANNTTLMQWLPISNIGKIRFGFNNVRAQGRVGLIVKEDSLVPQNYDLDYKPSDVRLTVNYHVDGDTEVENEISNPNIENTLGQTIWAQLTETLTNLLHDILVEIVVEFSLTELVIDRDEEYRQIANASSIRANKLLDSLLCSAKDYLVAQNKRSVATPAFDVIYKGKGIAQGTLHTQQGYVEDMATLTRSNDFSLFEDKYNVTIYGAIALRDFKIGYKQYASKYEDTAIEGSIKGAVYRNDIQLKITVKKEGERCTTLLDKVAVHGIRDIDIDVSGLASLSWLQDNVKSWVIGNLRQQTVPVMEQCVIEAFQQAIAATDCVALLAD